MTIPQFKNIVLDFYSTHRRELPWRYINDGYRILVSEIMLQQTQVSRVLPKYEAFIKVFPDFSSLAGAGNAELIGLWQGLGYNRRALNLKKTAEIIFRQYNSILPESRNELLSLPGIGNYTSAALQAFVYNIPSIVIDTNIRRVVLYSFFYESNREDVSDKEIIPFLEEAVLHTDPRTWYYALMDYGSYLGKVEKGINRKSKHYVRQSRFEGSVRQLRGNILKLLYKNGDKTLADLAQLTGKEHSELEHVLSDLKKEGFIVKETSGSYNLKE